MELPGQGSDPSLSLNLSGNTGSLTHCARPGIEPVSQHFQDATNPLCHSGMARIPMTLIRSFVNWRESRVRKGFLFLNSKWEK